MDITLGFEETHMQFLSLWHKTNKYSWSVEEHLLSLNCQMEFVRLAQCVNGSSIKPTWRADQQHWLCRSPRQQVPGTDIQGFVSMWFLCHAKFCNPISAKHLFHFRDLLTSISVHGSTGAILIVNLQQDSYTSSLLNRNFWSLDNIESHAGDCWREECTEVSSLTLSQHLHT